MSASIEDIVWGLGSQRYCGPDPPRPGMSRRRNGETAKKNIDGTFATVGPDGFNIIAQSNFNYLLQEPGR